MYIKQEFISDLQRSVDEGEYIVGRSALCAAIVYDQALLQDHYMVLYSAESIAEFCITQYFIVRVNDKFTLLAVISCYNHKDLLQIIEFSHFPLYSDAMQRMLDIENTDF
jgi:hypothetical protein